MSNPTQATRHIAIDTPLGEDTLLLRSFYGREEISGLFEFNLDLYSEDGQISFDDIIGKNVTIRMTLPEGGERYWNGFISRFAQGVTTSPQFAQYRATMVPWLWFMTRTSDCRIFQEKTVPEIIKQVFDDQKFSHIEDRLSGGYRTWTYCVQYRETDFNFVSRLMEQEGIYYYYKHEQGKCTLVLCDSPSKHDAFDIYDEIEFTPDTHASAQQEKIRQWTVEKIIQSGKFVHTDYNFEKPSTSLMSSEEDAKNHDESGYEIFDYPGEHTEKSEGDWYAGIRMEELAQPHEICSGQTDSRGICPGYVFSLARHTRREQNREHLILSAQYQAAAADYETSGGQDDICTCSFTAMNSEIQFRPTRKTPKPIIQGTQTAVVTGPAGEEIYTDEYGRVKVQFHWDREGKHDENSSCWIRVSQVHAGKGFGGIDIPRVEEEVIVSFMEGDPDRPLITGRVYHAESMPPFGLPDKKVVSGMKSKTYKDGGYNEFTLDDTPGDEKIIVHGQYDMATTIEHDESYDIGNNRKTTVAVDDSETIGANQTVEVGANQNVTIGAKRELSIKASDTVDIGASRSVTTVGSYELTVGGSLKIGVTGSISISANAGVTVTVGASTVDIGPAAVSIKSPTVTTEGMAMVETKGAVVISQAQGINEIKGATVKLN